MTLKRIISGGQTGADRAALDSARIGTAYSWGGWSPRGKISEEPGGIPLEYFESDRVGCGMKEAQSSRYQQRTAWNIRDSDATLILRTASKIGPGTKLTIKLLRQKNKLYLICNPNRTDTAIRVARWICEAKIDHTDKGIEVLNVAGPRESKSPGVYARSYQYLMDVWHIVMMAQDRGIEIWKRPKRH